jgi:hypothetical protein
MTFFTVADLRRFIENLPDNTLLVGYHQGQGDYFISGATFYKKVRYDLNDPEYQDIVSYDNDDDENPTIVKPDCGPVLYFSE